MTYPAGRPKVGINSISHQLQWENKSMLKMNAVITNVRGLLFFILVGLLMFVGATDCRAAEAKLVPVFKDNLSQFTGVAVSKTGRLFVNYPRWQGPHDLDV